MNNTLNNTGSKFGIRYLEEETIVYLPYLILNFVGIIVGTAGKILKNSNKRKRLNNNKTQVIF